MIAMECYSRRSACIYCLICYSFESRWHAYAKSGGRESPGMRVTFFRVAKRKSPKKGRPYCLRPLRCATGQPGVLGHGVRRGTRFALRAPLRQPRRARARSTRAPTPMLTPQPPRRRRSQQGVGQPNIHPGHRCARSSVRSAWRLRPRDGAERSDGPCGCRSGSLLDAPGARSEFCGATCGRAPQVAS